jgi:hypothetical protein
MGYDEKIFKAKANIKARRLWLVFAILLTANYGTDKEVISYLIKNGDSSKEVENFERASFLLFYAGCLSCVVTYF